MAAQATLLPGSVFGRPASLGVAHDSDVVSQALLQLAQTHYGAIGVNELPIFTVSAATPRVALGVNPGCADFRSEVGTVPIPSTAYTTDPSYQHDSAIVIYQPSSHSDWELWQAKRSPDGAWSACWGGRLDTTTSDGVFPSPYGMSASGISYLATTITEADVAQGQIDHAIAMQVPACDHWIPPADRGDCQVDPGMPHEGTLFRLPADLATPPGLTPFATMVFHALQRYGAVVTDQGGAVMIQAESAADWRASGHQGVDPMTASWAGQPEYYVLKGMPWQSLQVVSSPGDP